MQRLSKQGKSGEEMQTAFIVASSHYISAVSYSQPMY